jgi:hypothetical protein
VRTGVRDAAGLILCFLILTACSSGPESRGLPERPRGTGGPSPLGHIAYQPPLLPITFTIDTDGKIKVAVATRLVNVLGTVTVSGGIVTTPTGERLPPEPADVTQLIICQQDSAGQRCEAYQIGTGRKIRIEMNGNFVQDVERNRIVIEAALGSIIEVTDSGPPTKLEAFGPARLAVEEFRFHETSEETDVDLERSRSGTTTDLSYDHITADLKPIHGAKISIYESYRWTEPDVRNDYPSELECLQVPAEDWKDAFSKDDLDHKYIVACIKTAEADMGFLLIEPDTDKKPVAYYVYTHTWVR